MADRLMIVPSFQKPDATGGQCRQRDNVERVVVQRRHEISMQQLVGSARGPAAWTVKAGQQVELADGVEIIFGRIKKE